MASTVESRLSSSTTSELGPPSGTTKRSRNEEGWGKTKAKKLRNLGMEYQSRNTHRHVEARKVGPPCVCKVRCFHLLGMKNIQLIFHDFWDLGDYNLQNAYIQKQVGVSATKRRRTNDPEKMRNNMKQFSVVIRNVKVPVCKSAFLSIHGISRSRVDTACVKKRSENGIPLPDNRGKAGTHQQIPADRLVAVLEHVRSIPTLPTHSTSHKTPPQIQYYHPDMKSKQQLYELYKIWLPEKYPEMERVTHHYYVDVLRKHFNHLRFVKPNTDHFTNGGEKD